MPKRHFTPAEANRTLPLVRRIVADLLERGSELRRLAPKQKTDPDARDRVHALELEIRGFSEELESIGCEYKDWGFDHGLVDFPSEIEDEPVLLCWRSDEAELTWYHSPEAGFAGRRQIPAHLLDPAPAASRD